MSGTVGWGRIVGFGLVCQGDAVAGFLQALGFVAAAPQPIAPAELALLGLAGTGVRQRLRLGAAQVDLDRFDPPGRAYPAGLDAAALAFQHLALVTDDVDAAWGRAEAAGAVPISRAGPVTLPPAAGGVRAVKFRTPEGHPLELIGFPATADHGWAGHGVLGIDHSAISVADVGRSVAFYAAGGLVAEPGSHNHGPAQDALDGLAAARPTVVPLRPPAAPTPHLELLGYQPPATAAVQWAANDVLATRIRWSGGAPALVRDPDGHLHQLGG